MMNDLLSLLLNARVPAALAAEIIIAVDDLVWQLKDWQFYCVRANYISAAYNKAFNLYEVEDAMILVNHELRLVAIIKLDSHRMIDKWAIYYDGNRIR